MHDGVALGVVLAGAGLGAAIDLRTRRIPNAITFGTAIAGLALAALGLTGITPVSAILGLLLGLLLMLPGHVLGATGAGDVKLMAGVGAVLGLERIVPAFLLTAIAGGMLAVGISIAKGRLGATLERTSRLVARPAGARSEIEASGPENRFAYGPAIFAGSVLAALVA